MNETSGEAYPGLGCGRPSECIKIKVRTLHSKREIEIETEYFHHINEDIKQMYLRHVHTYCQNYRYVD